MKTVSKYISVFTIMRQSHNVWKHKHTERETEIEESETNTHTEIQDISKLGLSWTDKEIGSSERYSRGLTPTPELLKGSVTGLSYTGRPSSRNVI